MKNWVFQAIFLRIYKSIVYISHIFFTTNKPCCRIRRIVIIKKFQSVAFATELTSCIKPSVLLIVEWSAKMKSCFAKVVWSSFKMTKTNIYDVWNAMRNPLGLKRILPDFIIDLMLDDVKNELHWHLCLCQSMCMNEESKYGIFQCCQFVLNIL